MALDFTSPSDIDLLRGRMSSLREEERFFQERLDQRVVFFGGLLGSAFAASVVALSSAKDPVQALGIAIALTFVFPFRNVAVSMVQSAYRRFIEAIEQRVKIEMVLGITETTLPDSVPNHGYRGKPLLAERHHSAQMNKTPEEFRLDFLKHDGLYHASRRLFDSSRVLAIVLIAVCTVMAWRLSTVPPMPEKARIATEEPSPVTPAKK